MADPKNAVSTGEIEQIAKIAHDLNNLLTVIESYTALAEYALPEGHDARTDLATVRDAAKKADELVRELGAVVQARRVAADG